MFVVSADMHRVRAQTVVLGVSGEHARETSAYTLY